MTFNFIINKNTCVRATAAFVTLVLASCAEQKRPLEPFSRAKAAGIIADARKIVTPNGIERLEKVQIGGIEQWVSIRGRDRRNPVLLVIHGGPGYVLMPMSWWSGRDWEEYFTVVQWDQRGSGKTYLLNDPQKVGPTMTLARTVADAEEMTNWLRKELGKKKIFLLAHSAGTYVGLQMAERHPDWLHAYIGVGEMADMPESERRGWTFAMNAARRTGNAQAVRELEAIAPYFAPGHPNPLKDVITQRKWVSVFGGTMAFRDGSKADTDLGELSPDYTDAEIPHLWDGNKFTESYLLADLLSHDWSVPKLDCPVIFFAGRHDYIANSQVVAAWFERLQSPSKRFVWFENSGHMPMTEEPGKFLMSLVDFVRPLAERVGDGLPDPH
jgi:pimeloyl-ACP methyl ester carboxylesterase